MSKQNQLDELRPTGFEGYIGQEAVKEQLDVAIEAAKERKDVLDHILIFGPPGYGKTTLANIIAEEMEANLIKLLGGNLRSTKDLYFLRNIQKGTEVFIDEIHRVWAPAQEMLYPAMEDGILNYKFGGLSLTRELPPFTLVGATTEVGKLQQPFIDRFELKLELVPYSPLEMRQIITNSADRLNLTITDTAIQAVAKASGGTPRVANNILKRLRDFAQYHEVKNLDKKFVDAILRKEGMIWQVQAG